MKKIITSIFLLTFMGFSFNACSNNTKEKETQETTVVDPKNVVKTTIGVDGMTCESCENNIETTAGKFKGIVSVKASHVEKNTIVEFDQTQTDEQKIKEQISEMGYKIIDSNSVQTKDMPQMKCGAGKCGSAMMETKK